MEFMGRHNLVLNINIGWINNSGDAYTWVNNILIINVIWFTIVQLIIFCEENSISALRNLSIHMLVSFFVVNSRACDYVISQFVVYALWV
jgi:hypothetical protein